MGIEGTRFHYVTAGTGDPVLLLPGWPESWIAWRKVLPLLVSAGRRVILTLTRAVSVKATSRLAVMISTLRHATCMRFCKRPIWAAAKEFYIVAHDVGTWIAHAHAVSYPADVRRLVLTEVKHPWCYCIPVRNPERDGEFEELAIRVQSAKRSSRDSGPRTGASLSRLDLRHEEHPILRNRLAALEEYTRQYSVPGAMRAGFAWYRVNFGEEGLAQAKARSAKRLTMPVLALGGSDGVGDALRATVATLGDSVQGGRSLARPKAAVTSSRKNAPTN